MPPLTVNLTDEQLRAYDAGQTVLISRPAESIKDALIIGPGKHVYYVREGLLYPDGYMQFVDALHVRDNTGRPLNRESKSEPLSMSEPKGRGQRGLRIGTPGVRLIRSDGR